MVELDWSEPYQLADRLNASPPDTGVYRIWYEGQDSTLAYIGESNNIASRFYNHEKTFGEDSLFAHSERSDLDASHKRKENKTDLIGRTTSKLGNHLSRSSSTRRIFLCDCRQLNTGVVCQQCHEYFRETPDYHTQSSLSIQLGNTCDSRDPTDIHIKLFVRGVSCVE